MPIYEYRCSKCKHVFEFLLRSQGDQADIACPECRGKKVERRLSVFAARNGQRSACDSMPAPENCMQCDTGGSCPYKP